MSVTSTSVYVVHLGRKSGWVYTFVNCSEFVCRGSKDECIRLMEK